MLIRDEMKKVYIYADRLDGAPDRMLFQNAIWPNILPSLLLEFRLIFTLIMSEMITIGFLNLNLVKRKT